MTADCHHACELRPEPAHPGRASVCADAKVESSSATTRALTRRSRIGTEDMRWVVGREKICIDKTVAFDHVAASYFDATRAAAARKHRPGAHEGVELAALAAGVDRGRQVVEQILIEQPSSEASVELTWIDADKMCAEAGSD